MVLDIRQGSGNIFRSKGWQFQRIFRPPNSRPKDGRWLKNERLRVGDELGNGHDLGGQKILLNCHPGFLVVHGPVKKSGIALLF